MQVQVIIKEAISNVFFEGFSDTQKQEVYEVVTSFTSYMEKGVAFSPAYKSGRWDGRHRLAHYKRSESCFLVPTGLLCRVCQALKSHFSDVVIDIDDHRKKPYTRSYISPLKELEGVTLRPYQERMIEGVLASPEKGESFIKLSSKEAKHLHSGIKGEAPYRVPGLGIWWSATGSGKTEASAGLIGRLGVPTLFVVYGKDLVLQTWERFQLRLGSWLKDHNLHLGMAIQGQFDPGFVTVASASTLAKALEGTKGASKSTLNALRKIGEKIPKYEGIVGVELKEWVLEYRRRIGDPTSMERLTMLASKIGGVVGSTREVKALASYPARAKKAYRRKQEMLDYLDTVDLLIYDEAHGAASEGHYKLSMSCNAYYRLAMSGTPLYRADAANLKVVASFGDPSVRITNAEMVESGVVPEATIRIIPIREKMPYSPWPKCYEDGIVFHPARNQAIIDLCLQYKGKPTLVMYKSIEHGLFLMDMAELSDIRAMCLSGKHGTEERQYAVDQLRKGEIDVLFASGIFNQGIDIPEVSVVINAAGGKAAIPVLQGLGRGLRGDELVMVDFADGQHKTLASHARERLRLYREQGCFKITF